MTGNFAFNICKTAKYTPFSSLQLQFETKQKYSKKKNLLIFDQFLHGYCQMQSETPIFRLFQII